MPFKKGKSGNPNGRPKGSRNKKRRILGQFQIDDTKGVEIVYFIRCIGTDFYKIGITTNLQHRLLNISSSNPHKIQLLKFWIPKDYNTFESILLDSLSFFNVKGEWFVLTDKIEKEIIKIKDYNDLIEFKGKYSNTLF